MHNFKSHIEYMKMRSLYSSTICDGGYM